MPTLSILLPTYNGARFLSEQIQSICAQSFQAWELIVIDDGSTDQTVQLVNKLAGEDRRIRILPAQGNLGQKRRLAELIAQASGSLISIADQDDRWAPDKLERLIAALGDADLSFGSSWLINEQGEQLGRTLLDGYAWSLKPEFRLAYLIRPAVSAHGMVGRRDLMMGASLRRGQQFDWLLSLEAVFNRGVVYVPEARTFHRMHANNQMNGHAAERRSLKIVNLAEARVQLAAVTERRFDFTARLEHLAFSDHIPVQTASIFAQAHKACYDAWFGRRRSFQWRGVALFHRLTQLLRPLSGSERDWSYAAGSMAALTQNTYHPGRALMHVRRTLRPDVDVGKMPVVD